MEPLIIECAINEQVSKGQNPAVPIDGDEIVADTLAAAEAGAAIVHLHARDPGSGDLLHPGTEVYRDVMRRIRRENPDVILYPTYGFSPTPEERFSHIDALAGDPEVRLDFATIDPGAVNYAGVAAGDSGLQPDWVLSVSHAECRHFFDLCARHAMQWSFTVRELGHVRHVLAYRQLGWVTGPLLFKLTMSGNHVWGIPPSVEGLHAFTRQLDLAGAPYRYMTYVEGDCHAELSRHAVENGGHVRTGIGDNPLFEGEPLTNAQQVERVVDMARAAGRDVATPKEARRLLRSEPRSGG